MKQQLFTTDDAVSTECAVNTKCRGRLLAMAAGILSVLILLVTAMQFVVSAGADRYSEYSDDCRKFMMDYMKDSSSYDTLVNKTYMPYRNYVETLGRDTAFQAEMKAWELATLDLKSAAIQVTNSKEYKYHLGILMDILSDTTQNSDFISSLKNMADACHVSTTKAALKFGKEYNDLNMKLNPQDAKEIAAELSDIDTISSYMSVAGDISDLIEQSKNLDDLLNKLSQAQVIYDLTIGYADMMQDMYNRCDSDNTALKAALLTMRDLCNQSMSKVDMVALFAGSTVAEEAMKIALGEVQKEIVSAMGLTGTAITLAQSVGKMYANILFGTENIQAAYYELNALYNIENLIRESLANTTDADSFFAAFTLYEHVTYKAADYSTKYEEALYTDNIAGKLFAWVTGKDKQLEQYKKSIENCKGLVKLSFDTLQFSAYNAFIESKYTSDVSSYFTVTDKYTLPSEETITQNDENIELLSLQTCGLPDESYTLDDDLTILNNLYHSNGTIYLNGHTLTINGDLILEGGSIDVDGGELIIKGDYDAYVPVENADGTTSYTGGQLYMNNTDDKVTVDGDFNTYTDYNSHYDGYLKLGSIEIKGNLNDRYYIDGANYYGLYSDGTKFIFSGTGKQTITATDGYIYFKNVEFVNKDTTGSIEFDNTSISCYIEKDETVTGNLCIEDMDLKGHKLTVNGDLKLWDKLSLNGGELYITGDYNAYIPVKNSNGTTSYTGGQLYMNNTDDKVTVDGDFNTYTDYNSHYDGYLKLGSIEIKGNLNDRYYIDGANYYGLYSDGTKFIFSGTGKQTITATDGYIYFKNVEFVNKDTTGSIEFDNTSISCYIEKDETVTGNLCIEDMDLKGHKLTVNGDLKLWDKLSLGGGGELYITGNYDAYIPVINNDGTTGYTGGYLDMGNVNDKVTVDGDFNTYRDNDNLDLGAIEIKGNLNDYYCYGNNDYTYNGLHSDGTKFIFSGKGKQTINATDGYIYFQKVDFVDTKNREIVVNCEINIELCGDAYITGDNATVRGNLNGYALNVSKDLTVNDTLYIQGGCLNIEGDLYNYGAVNLGSGSLIVNGNYNAYKSTSDTDGTITYSDGGYLYMDNVNDKVTVNGDFNTYTDYNSHYDGYLKLGSIEIKGNLNDRYYIDSANYYGLYSDGTKFIFSGTGKQTITATDGYIYFKNVEFVNKDTTGSIEFDNTSISCYIEKDETVTGNLCIEDMDLKGHKLTVNGDLKLWNKLSLNGGELYITGDYNAYIPVKNSNGTTSYTGGQLYMNNTDDKVTVDGDFNTYTDYNSHYDGYLKLGSIEIKGNLNDRYYIDGANYYGLYSDGTKFIFSGTGKQTITALDGKLVLNTAEFVNKDVQIACSTDIDVDVPVRVHDYSDEWTVDKPATCSAEGSKSRHCTRCDAKTEVTAIAKIAHTYTSKVVEPTLTQQGYTLHKCSVCGYSYKDNYTPALKLTELTGVKVKTQGTNSLTLAWDKNASAKGYIIEQYKGGKWTQVAKTSSNTAVTYTVNGLAADTTYTFRIKAYVISGESEIYGGYVKIAGKTRIPNVAKFTGSAVSQTAVKLDWSKNDKATGYVIEQYKGGKWTALATTKNNTTLTFTVKGLADDTAYSFRIKSYRTVNGVTDFSEYTSVKAKTLLGNVKTFTATATGTTAIKLDWSKNNKATAYVIEQYKGGKWTVLATTKNNTTLTFTVKGLAKGTTYSFRIKSFRKTGGTTEFSEYTAIKAATLLDGVSDLKVTSTTGTWITLGWDRNTGATGYVLEQYKGGRWTEIAVTKNNTTLKFTVKGLRNDTTYSFRIKAYKTVGDTTTYGSYVRVVGTTDIPNVAKFTGSAVSASAVKLDWSKNDKATGYVIEQYKGGRWTEIKAVDNDITEITVEGLAKGTAYTFRIKSVKTVDGADKSSEYASVKVNTAE